MRIAARAQLVVVAWALVLLFVLLLGGAARAAGPSVDDEKQARNLYERAEKNFDVGKFVDALADYQSAYEAKPLPGFLFNIAQCYRNMGNFERARFFFRRYLTLDPRAPNRRRVDELIAEMSKQLDAQAAAVAPTSGTAPPPVEAPPVVAPLTTPPSPTPPPLAPSAPSVASATPTLTAKATPETRHPAWKRWWFWTGVGAVVVGGVVAAFFLTRPETQTPGSLPPIDGRAP
jgi:hypothetical protein